MVDNSSAAGAGQQQKKVVDPSKWKPGSYKARPIDWMVTKTAAGLPQVSVLFEYEQAGDMPGTLEKRQLTWYGSFKGGAQERTIESLAMLGLRQPPYPAMESGREGKALDEAAEVEIVVEHRKDLNGVTRAGVAWVNRIGGRGLQSKLEAGEGNQVFAEANQAFEAFLKANPLPPRAGAPAATGQAQATGSQGGATKAAPLTGGPTPSFTEDDIPF
jgi:hypothetical protein